MKTNFEPKLISQNQNKPARVVWGVQTSPEYVAWCGSKGYAESFLQKVLFAKSSNEKSIIEGMKNNSTMVIQDKATKLYITQAAYELWDDGHDLDGLDMWTDDIQMAAWISSDDAPTGMDMERFALVSVE